MIPCRTEIWKPSAAAEKFYVEHKPALDKKIRDRNSRDATPYEFFLSTFGGLPLKHPLKHEFLLLCWQQQWPNTMQLESRGVLNDWAIRMARGFCWSKRINLMGAGSTGKTACAAAYCYTVWKSRPFNSSVFLSTTSAEAGQSRTWGTIKFWHTSDQFTVGKRIESLHLITLDEEVRDEEGAKNRDLRDAIKCVNVKKGSEGENVMAAIVGRKNDIVLWCCDEFPFMDVGVLDARVNLNTNPFYQFIGLGNAPKEGDPMYLDCTPFGDKFPDGWRSVDKDVHQSWPTEKGLCLYFNGATSPNFRALDEKVPFPKLMNESIRKELVIDAGGEDSPMYWKQFYGFPPTVDISDKVLTVKLMENHGVFAEAVWSGTGQKVLAGLDLGFREDGDPCVLQFAKIGKNTEARTVLGMEGDGVALVPRQGSKEAFEPQIAKMVIEKCRERGCHDLCLDVTGDGGILLQHIEREARDQKYALNVLPVSFSGSPEDRVIIPGEKRNAREMFDKMVAQLWVSFRVSVLNNVICGMSPHSNCTKQFCARKMGTDDKKRQTVEPKKKMKLRFRRSPDHADAAVCLHHLALRHGLSGMVVADAKKEPFDPVKFLQQKTGARYQSGPRTVYSGR